MGRNTLKLDLSGFNELVIKLESLQGDVNQMVKDALEKAGEKIERDTLAAIQRQNLPAKGKFSQGDTEKSVVQNPSVTWSGTTAEINVGFDYSKHGAGGYLIKGYFQDYHGTPRVMKPDMVLKKMYTGKKYMRDIQNELLKTASEAIAQKMEGR